MGNCSCQQQIHNRQAKHFSYDFKTKNREEIFEFFVTTYWQKNEEIEFEEGGDFPSSIFWSSF